MLACTTDALIVFAMSDAGGEDRDKDQGGNTSGTYIQAIHVTRLPHGCIERPPCRTRYSVERVIPTIARCYERIPCSTVAAEASHTHSLHKHARSNPARTG